MANKNQVQNLSNEELNSVINDLQSELTTLRYENATAPLANSSAINKVRRQIARLLTEQRAREITTLAAAGTLPARDKKIARRRRSK